MKELQELDANCNDCIFMIRDFKKVPQRIAEINEERLRVFEIKKQKLLDSGSEEALKEVKSMVFAPTKKINQAFGFCTQFRKDVDFIPSTCQIHTQECFVHRKELKW